MATEYPFDIAIKNRRAFAVGKGSDGGGGGATDARQFRKGCGARRKFAAMLCHHLDGAGVQIFGAGVVA